MPRQPHEASTIAATAGDARTLTGYRVTQGIEAMLAAIPGAADVADIRCEQPFNVDSRDLGTAQVLRLARAADRHLRDPDVDGVVITHYCARQENAMVFMSKPWIASWLTACVFPAPPSDRPWPKAA